MGLITSPTGLTLFQQEWEVEAHGSAFTSPKLGAIQKNLNCCGYRDDNEYGVFNCRTRGTLSHHRYPPLTGEVINISK